MEKVSGNYLCQNVAFIGVFSREFSVKVVFGETDRAESA